MKNIIFLKKVVLPLPPSKLVNRSNSTKSSDESEDDVLKSSRRKEEKLFDKLNGSSKDILVHDFLLVFFNDFLQEIMRV